MPRVAPITGKSDVPAEYHDVVDGVLQVFGQIRGPFSMLLHSPKLAERMLNLREFLPRERQRRCAEGPQPCHPRRRT